MDLMGEEKLKAGLEKKLISCLCNVSLCSKFGVCCYGGLVGWFGGGFRWLGWVFAYFVCLWLFFFVGREKLGLR